MARTKTRLRIPIAELERYRSLAEDYEIVCIDRDSFVIKRRLTVLPVSHDGGRRPRRSPRYRPIAFGINEPLAKRGILF